MTFINLFKTNNESVRYLSKNILLSEEKLLTHRTRILTISIITLLLSFILKITNTNPFILFLSNIFEFTSVSFLLVYLSHAIQGSSITRIITFFGMYSLIVLGLHDMYLTTFLLIIQNIIGTMNVTLGICNLILTSILLWPSIYLLNKYFPQLIGKKEVLKIK